MIEVSVIIPTYNRKRELAKALASVFQQKNVGYEALVVDDGSTDDTAGMIHSEFPAAQYFRQDNQGPAAARNLGMEHARGEWFAFLDSDDEWLPGKLEAQMNFFAVNPHIWVCQTEEIWIRNGKRVNPMKKHAKKGGWIFKDCLPLCLISPSAVIIHRDVIESCGAFDPSYPACEDYELWLRISSKYEVGLISTPYIKKYGGHDDQLSRRYEAMDRFRIRALAKILCSETLTAEQAQAASEMLKEKTRIYFQGLHKRGKQDAELETLIRSLEILK